MNLPDSPGKGKFNKEKKLNSKISVDISTEQMLQDIKKKQAVYETEIEQKRVEQQIRKENILRKQLAIEQMEKEAIQKREMMR